MKKIVLAVLLIFLGSTGLARAQASSQEPVILPSYVVSCSTADLAKNKARLLEILGGENNLPVNVNIDDKVRTLKCQQNESEIIVLANDLRELKSRQDYRLNMEGIIKRDQLIVFWSALIFCLLLAVFLVWRGWYWWLSILLAGLLYFVLVEGSFLLTMSRLSKIGDDGPPFILAIFASIVLPLIGILAAAGLVVDVILARRRKKYARD